jgi:hypothetical protein
MTRQGDAKQEDRQTKLVKDGGQALNGAFERALRESGADLTGLNLRFNGLEWLATIKAEVDGVPSVAFVGSGTLLLVIVKATREASGRKLRWRKDKWAAK